VIYCSATYGERVDQSLKGLRRIAPAVDKAIILVDQTVTQEQKGQLKAVIPAKWRW